MAEDSTPEWWVEAPAEDMAEVRRRHAANRSAWNQAAEDYTNDNQNRLEFLRNGGISLHALERAHVGDLAEWCDTAIHLQCASGRDTLSLLNAGARRGGLFHVLDDHAAAYLFDQDSEEFRPSGADYFANISASRGWTAEYVGDLGRPLAEHAVKHERLWPPSSVFTALTGAGLIVEQFGEHADEYWPAFPRLSEDVRKRIPMTFTMTARKTAQRAGSG